MMNPSVIPAPHAPKKRRVLSARRIALLATTIAGLGAAALVVAPGLNLPSGYPTALAQKIIRDGLSVRQAEALAQKGLDKSPGAATKRVEEEKDPDTRALEQLLSGVTGLKVSVNHRDKGGDVRIAYKTLEQLDDLCRRLQR